MEELLAKHRKENKELTSKITGLKKTMKSSNKQRKKEIQDEITQLELDTKSRQEMEIKSLNEISQKSIDEPAPDTNELETSMSNIDVNDSSVQHRQPKVNKAKRRKEKKQAEFESMRQSALEEVELMPNLKEIEDQSIDTALKPLTLQIHHIIPDGHCLYNSIAHQLNILDTSSHYTYKDLRHLAAEYMSTHSDDFLPFLVDDHGNMLNEESFKEYCSELEFGAVWGGQNEIQALTQALSRPIHIIQMNSPILKLGEEFDSTPIMLS
ncbi:hypothetical protein BC833DRAFT_579004 [Globomyces pollinis-pini]|nr:hypothetical protein BC833DRAFT_579004 [Globomyces pollinis-pini]